MYIVFHIGNNEIIFDFVSLNAEKVHHFYQVQIVIIYSIYSGLGGFVEKQLVEKLFKIPFLLGQNYSTNCQIVATTKNWRVQIREIK